MMPPSVLCLRITADMAGVESSPSWPSPRSTTLYFVASCCTVLHHGALRCTTVYCVALCTAYMLYYICVWYYVVLCRAMLYLLSCTSLYCVAPYWTCGSPQARVSSPFRPEPCASYRGGARSKCTRKRAVDLLPRRLTCGHVGASGGGRMEEGGVCQGKGHPPDHHFADATGCCHFDDYSRRITAETTCKLEQQGGRNDSMRWAEKPACCHTNPRTSPHSPRVMEPTSAGLRREGARVKIAPIASQHEGAPCGSRDLAKQRSNAVERLRPQRHADLSRVHQSCQTGTVRNSAGSCPSRTRPPFSCTRVFCIRCSPQAVGMRARYLSPDVPVFWPSIGLVRTVRTWKLITKTYLRELACRSRC
jgi:hypothetical protein